MLCSRLGKAGGGDTPTKAKQVLGRVQVRVEGKDSVLLRILKH